MSDGIKKLSSHCATRPRPRSARSGNIDQKKNTFVGRAFHYTPFAAIEQPHVCCQMRCIFSVSLQSPTCYGKNICVWLKRLPEASQGRVCWAVSSWHQGVEVARWRGDSSCLGPGTCEGHALVQKHLKSQGMILIFLGGYTRDKWTFNITDSLILIHFIKIAGSYLRPLACLRTVHLWDKLKSHL